jgi:hypothetical protein
MIPLGSHVFNHPAPAGKHERGRLFGHGEQRRCIVKGPKGILGNAFAITVAGFALLLVFGAPLLNGFVDLMRALGAN